MRKVSLENVKNVRSMSKTQLEDEVMLLRAQVKVLQNWLAMQKAKVSDDEQVAARARETIWSATPDVGGADITVRFAGSS